MTKFTIFLLIVVSLFVSLTLDSKTAAYGNQFALAKTIETPKPKNQAKIENILLDRNEVLYGCPLSCDSIPEDNELIKVKTIVSNPKNITLFYDYTVSSGRITGEGENVTWDLKNIKPGIYKITAAIKGTRGVSSETKTAIVTVRKCLCDPTCVCPAVSMTGGGNIKAGETVDFTIGVSSSYSKKLSYNWTISQGEIIEGQGTPKITVKTTKEMIGIIEATVEISGSELCSVCPRTFSDTATFIK